MRLTNSLRWQVHAYLVFPDLDDIFIDNRTNISLKIRLYVNIIIFSFLLSHLSDFVLEFLNLKNFRGKNLDQQGYQRRNPSPIYPELWHHYVHCMCSSIHSSMCCSNFNPHYVKWLMLIMKCNAVNIMLLPNR